MVWVETLCALRVMAFPPANLTDGAKPRMPRYRFPGHCVKIEHFALF